MINAAIRLQNTSKMPAEKSLQGIEAEGVKKCPECGSEEIIRESNELYCKKCGFVIDG